MKKILTILSILLTVGCHDIIGSNNVFELHNVNLTVTEMEATNTRWKVSGTVVNTGDTTVLAPWYVEAEFYADSTFSLLLGGDQYSFNVNLNTNTSTFWTLKFSSSEIVESNYTDFAIKNFRAFIKKNN